MVLLSIHNICIGSELREKTIFNYLHLLATFLIKKLYFSRHKNFFFLFSIKTYVVGTQKNHLNETILFYYESHQDSCSEYPQHMFWLRNKKIIF